MHASCSPPSRGPAWRGGRCLLGGFIVGVALQLQQAALWGRPAYAWLAGMAVVVATAAILLSRRAAGRDGTARSTVWSRIGRGLAVAAAAVAMCALGFACTGWRASVFQSEALDPALEGRDIEVTGTVAAMPQVADDGLRFRLAVMSARLIGDDGEPAATVHLPPTILLGWYAAQGGREAQALAVGGIDGALDDDGDLPAIVQQRQPQALRAGEHWRMTVRLKAPHGTFNPHGFDQELALWEQGIQATGSVRVGKGSMPPRRWPAGGLEAWSHPVELARQVVREAIYRRVADRRLAGVLAALVVGDQAAIGRADWEIFRTTGVAHLMSISGLHITM